ncbi:AraC family transcriptional regulator, partial [Escherichia coli]
LNCENNIIDVSSLNNTLVAHISHDIIKDYLRFLNKDLSQIPVWQRSATPILTLPCLTPDVFRVAAQHSMMPAETESEKERTRALLFTVLSRFLDSKKFVSLMMYMLRNCVSDSVYQIIESDIHKDWNLSMVASCLCLSPSLLKKKLKSENTSYSQIITTCRMRYAVNELMMDGKNISQVSQSCGYNSTSYFISVFKDFYGMTPLHYVSQHRERTVA